jgi:hypothetical protein
MIIQFFTAGKWVNPDSINLAITIGAPTPHQYERFKFSQLSGF